jgi:hypothetical protein
MLMLHPSLLRKGACEWPDASVPDGSRLPGRQITAQVNRLAWQHPSEYAAVMVSLAQNAAAGENRHRAAGLAVIATNDCARRRTCHFRLSLHPTLAVLAGLAAFSPLCHQEAGARPTYHLGWTDILLTNGIGAAMQTQDFSRLAGIWSGQIPTMMVQLDIQPSGSFRWMAVAGNARAEGAGHIQTYGSGYAILLPFLAPDPLELRAIGNVKKFLTIDMPDGNQLKLTRGALNRNGM